MISKSVARMTGVGESIAARVKKLHSGDSRSLPAEKRDLASLTVTVKSRRGPMPIVPPSQTSPPPRDSQDASDHVVTSVVSS